MLHVRYDAHSIKNKNEKGIFIFRDRLFTHLQIGHYITFWDYEADIEHFLNDYFPIIKYTFETEKDNSIAFLDVIVTRVTGKTWSQGKLCTTIYRKPTHTNRYINFKSHHPLSQ